MGCEISSLISDPKIKEKYEKAQILFKQIQLYNDQLCFYAKQPDNCPPAHLNYNLTCFNNIKEQYVNLMKVMLALYGDINNVLSKEQSKQLFNKIGSIKLKLRAENRTSLGDALEKMESQKNIWYLFERERDLIV